MARRTTVTLVDDIDGSEADESVSFGLDRADYEIDLSESNAGALRDVLAPFVTAARRTGGRRGSTTPRREVSAAPSTNGRSRTDTREIRAWAVEHGATLPARGRLAASVVEAFDANDPSKLTDRHAEDTPGSIEPDQAIPDAFAASSPEPTAAHSSGRGTEPAEDLPRGSDGLTAPERDTIRAWALEQGIEVKGRGQLKKDLIANHQAWARRAT